MYDCSIATVRSKHDSHRLGISKMRDHFKISVKVTENTKLKLNMNAFQLNYIYDVIQLFVVKNDDKVKNDALAVR